MPYLACAPLAGGERISYTSRADRCDNHARADALEAESAVLATPALATWSAGQ
jgi:hypothetical protein